MSKVDVLKIDGQISNRLQAIWIQLISEFLEARYLELNIVYRIKYFNSLGVLFVKIESV